MTDASDPRELVPLDNLRSKTPFNYEGNVLGSLREDQVPKFLSTLTDQDTLPIRTVKLPDLTALQNRVETGKVQDMHDRGTAEGKPAVVVKMGGSKYIADGHHRLAAQWLGGADTADVRYKSLERQSNTLKRQPAISAVKVGVCKVDDELGLVIGWAVISTIKGEPYFDTQGDHIPDVVMLKMATHFMENVRAAKEMHAGPTIGKYVFAWPMTADIAKAMGVATPQTGLMVGMKPDSDAILQKFRDGTYTGFSIGGSGAREEVS